MVVFSAYYRKGLWLLVFLTSGTGSLCAQAPTIVPVYNSAVVSPLCPETGEPPNYAEWEYVSTQWKLTECKAIKYSKEKNAEPEIGIPPHTIVKSIVLTPSGWADFGSAWSCKITSETYGYYKIEFKGEYQFVYKSAIPGNTATKTEVHKNVSAYGFAVFYTAGFIDNVPNYSLDGVADSVNFFLRQHDKESKAADYQNLKIYYGILPSDISDRIEKVNFTVYQEENTTKAIKEIDGQKENGKYKAGNGLLAVWDDVREEMPDPADPTKKVRIFRESRFYQIQMNVKMKGEADPNFPNLQSNNECLVIHDLVYKHRPVVHMGNGETVAPSGPVYPFSEKVIGNYTLKKHGLLPGLPAALTQYSVAKSFPEFQIQDWFDFAKKYPVLEASIAHDKDGAEQHYIDIDDKKRNCDTSDTTLLHRGHVVHGTPENKLTQSYCFIQYWMYETASHTPFGPPGLNNVFWHEGDWEMVQLCIRVGGQTKAEWFRPHAATASQHYYGQTLAWRIDNCAPAVEILAQEYVSAADNGNRVNIYIAENAHATYFRSGNIATAWRQCGTQIQYEPVTERKIVDKITLPLITVDYMLIPLNYKDKQGIADWIGRWGSNVPGVLDRTAPQGPFLRAAHTNNGDLNLNNRPADFHNRCRKTSNGVLQTETEL